MSVYLSWGGPTFRATQYDHRPARTEGLAGATCLLLDLSDLQDTVFQRCRHRLVHAFRVATFDKIRHVAITNEQRLQFLMTDPGQQRWVVDLVAVKVQDWQDCAISDRIEEFVAVPAGGERAGFSLAIANHC